MLNVNFNEFEKLSKEFRQIPIIREIVGDIYTPISLLRNFSNEKFLFLLESANIDKSFSRFTYFAKTAKKTLIFKKGKLYLIDKNGKKTELLVNPIDYLNSEINEFKGAKFESIGDFCGGYVGFFGYEMANYMGILREKLYEGDESQLGLGYIDEFYVFDNKLGKFYSVCIADTSNSLEDEFRRCVKRTLEMVDELHVVNFDLTKSDSFINIKKDFEKDAFIETVKKVKDEIIRGEAIQVVISNKFEVDGFVNPVSFYRALRNINPSPYMFYFKFDDFIVCGSSPEIHLKIKDNRATLKPIAGTYPVEEDIEDVKRRLISDEKEISEHLMLLDLARNDLYRGCKSDTVKVKEAFVPEVYSHVVHIVSEVEGVKKDNISNLDLFAMTFPAGTVSGAPKVRAMELISQYERSPRGFYAGCAGYFSFAGDMDTCITIRSAAFKDGKMILRAGAGIVYDSNPEREFYEVENKLGALFKAIEITKNMEERYVFTDR
ncbi:anthranilate synthase component I family protein [Deferribacter thermophilus]|uniref:anthranilate synthase component I family protein n=1 Tax=Deferribacter thermophilus TaxID=53573 RepID=UPI003C24880D